MLNITEGGIQNGSKGDGEIVFARGHCSGCILKCCCLDRTQVSSLPLRLFPCHSGTNTRVNYYPTVNHSHTNQHTKHISLLRGTSLVPKVQSSDTLTETGPKHAIGQESSCGNEPGRRSDKHYSKWIGMS